MFVFLIIKLLVVIFFLAMFLRSSRLIWGIGLLGVTSAVLLDTFLSTFDREAMLADLGFFFYVLSGGILGTMAVWAWGVLRPFVAPTSSTFFAAQPAPMHNGREVSIAPTTVNQSETAVDRQMLFAEIRDRLGYGDLLDLMFDMDIKENEVMSLNQDMHQLIVNIMDVAEQRGQMGTLSLAVERILTSVPPEHLPRLEKLSADSPPTVLRQFLLAFYTLSELEQITTELGIDWEQVGAVANKREKVRGLLLHLIRRNRLPELIALLKKTVPVNNDEA